MSDTDIAVIGLSLRVPGARTAGQFWHNISQGVESIAALDDEQLLAAGVNPQQLQNPNYVKKGAHLDGVEWFDAPFFGFSGKEASVMDPQHRLFLETGWLALEDAGYDPFRYEGAIGVFGGSGHNAYLPYNLLGNQELLDSMGFFLLRHTGNDKDFLTTRLSYCLNLSGPSVNVQTACSTSLVAVHLASQSLMGGECDIALAGGVTIEMPLNRGYLYTPNEILSKDGHCRAFDADSSGTVFGSGAAIVVLKRLDDALDDGDVVRAVIRGSAVNNDGAAKAGYLAPSVDGQAQAILEALEIAEIDPQTVKYVEAHGTGTQIGDPIEIAALTAAYGAGTDAKSFCAVGSVKTNIGHLDTAAGTASLIKAILALEHQKLPPSLHYRRANTEIDFANSPFYVNTELSPWLTEDHPRRAGVSSLGVGGTNVHMIVEEARARAPSSPSARRYHPILMSAKTEHSLTGFTDNLVAHLGANPELPIADVAFTLGVARARFEVQLGLVVRGADELADVLDTPSHPQRLPQVSRLLKPRIVFGFSGQGAQYPGMGRGLYASEPVYRAAFDECCAIAEQSLGLSLRELILGATTEETSSRISQISLSQPALFAVEYSLAKLWMSWGITPDAVVGHSSGQVIAATFAGVFTLRQGMELIAERGRLMQTADAGSMLAVMLNEGEIQRFLWPSLDVAAINSPNMTVISGAPDDIVQLQLRLEKSDIECTQIKTSHAGHSQLLDPILDAFEAAVATASPQVNRIPLISNVSGRFIAASDVVSPQYWREHLRRTVRFMDGMSTLLKQGETVFIEVGPGSMLTQLASQATEAGESHVFVNSIAGVKQDAADEIAIVSALAHVWMAGVDFDWKAFYADEVRHKIPLPGYVFSRQRHWIDAPGAIRPQAAEANVDTWLYQPTWTAQSIPPGVDESAQVLVIGSPDVVLQIKASNAFDEKLVTASWGETTQTQSSPYRIRQGRAEDLASLFAQVCSDEPTQILYFLAPDSDDPTTTFFECFDLVNALADFAENVSLKVIVSGLAQIKRGDVVQPSAAMALGPVLCANNELGFATQVVDAGSEEFASPRFLETLQRLACDGDVVAWRDQLYMRTFERIAQQPPSADLEGGRVLITGGADGLGLHAAQTLARAGSDLVLLGRTELPPESDWADWLSDHSGDALSRKIQAIVDLRELGSEVVYYACDVANAEDVQSTVQKVRASGGPIHGIVHAAGIINDAPMLSKAKSDAIDVLSAKVDGIRNIVGAAGPDCSFVVGYSSISALTGVPGQCDYVSANAYLDAYLASLAQATDIRCLSLNWSAWTDLGMTQRLVEDEVRPVRSAAHPLVGDCLRVQTGVRVVSLNLTPAATWVLDEHRTTDGVAVMPGTAFLEMVKAAFDPLARYHSVELKDVLVMSPLALHDDESREIRIQFTPWSKGFQFSVMSQADRDTPENWFTHVQGKIQSNALTLPQHDFKAVSRRCRKRLTAYTNEQGAFLRFGPRWHCIRDVHRAKFETLIELELPGPRAETDAQFLSHPALLDVATAGALHLIPGYAADSHFYVPISYGQATFNGAMGTHWFSHVRFRADDSSPGDIVVFDVTIMDPSGRELARFDEFMLKNVSNASSISQATPPITTRTTPAAEQDPPAPNAVLKSRLEKWGIVPAQIEPFLTGAFRSSLSGAIVVSRQPPEVALDELAAVQAATAAKGEAGEHILDTGRVREVLQSFAGIVDTTVVAQRDRLGHVSVTGFVVLAADARATTSEVRRYARAHLPEDQAPTMIVELDSLPRKANGTVDTAALPNPHAANDDFVAPETETEIALAGVWQDVLGVQQISLTDNFFDLGGHSLLAVRVIAATKKLLDVRVDDVVMLTHTLEQVAAEVDNRRANDVPESGRVGRFVNAIRGSLNQ